MHAPFVDAILVLVRFVDQQSCVCMLVDLLEINADLVARLDHLSTLHQILKIVVRKTHEFFLATVVGRFPSLDLIVYVDYPL